MMIYSVLQGFGIGAFLFGLAFITTRGLGISISEHGYVLFIFYVIFGFAYWMFERLIKRRGALAYLASPVMKDQEVLLSGDGISFSNGRSTSFHDWRDIGSLVQAKDLIVATHGNQGFALPYRILSHAGDPATINRQITEWHQTATQSE